MDQKYGSFLKQIEEFIPADRIYTDDLRCLAWGTDAGFYRLVPQIVIRSDNEREVSRLLAIASELALPVTFRAAGTSLSGQTVTDSILIVAGKNWERYSLSPDASTITLQPGIIGQRVNDILAPYGKLFSPDPASKKSAMVGGIVINNASGMNCGTHANSDKILLSMRMVLADGTVLDTADEESRRAFRASHPEIINGIAALCDQIRADKESVERMNLKYSIKNVTGLNLQPFLRFDDPFDIMAHCMVGSEGTLAFMSEVTVKTEDIRPCTATAMLYFPSMHEACKAVVALKHGPVFSAELLDKKSLSSVNDTTGPNLTAILTETKADSPQQLQDNVAQILGILSEFNLYAKPEFTQDKEVIAKWWEMRSGVFPSVGGTRPLGTTVLIEDIAFHINDLPTAAVELEQLLVDHGYNDACIYGHALEGNFHFIIAQSFDSEQEVKRYADLMQAITRLVVDKYNGSLKAEHGTGRNMAPFVAHEWGDTIWGYMKRLKDLFDPKGILNKGVIFNPDPNCYISSIKPMPMANSHVNKCIECGFCEVNCVSCGYTLSARQRIVVEREIARLTTTGEDPQRLERIKKQFAKLGVDSCAGDGLCSTSCPMGINTGEMIHDLRNAALSPAAKKVGVMAGKHLNLIKGALKPVLSTAAVATSVIGDNAVTAIGRTLNKAGIPLWTPALPGAAHLKEAQQPQSPRKVVYFPSCINQTMGSTREHGHKPDYIVNVITRLCNKAGFEVIFPEGMSNLCCGMIWESKGMPDTAEAKLRELEAALAKASEGGKYPVLCDQSPCLHRMREHITSMHLYEPVEFILDVLSPHLEFTPTNEPVAIHVTCSSRLMGLTAKMARLASMCSSKVLLPAEVGCCGFAGDKGFTLPGLNRWGLRKLQPQVDKFGAKRGFSNSRTCEIGLTTNSGIPYKSIAYLVDECTKPKTN